MAFQLELPLLILKDRSILAEGILDQAVGEYLVFEFDLAAETDVLSAGIKETIRTWAAAVHSGPTAEQT